VATTGKGVEGLPWTEAAVAVADTPDEFAGRVHALLTDGERRRAMGAAALDIFRRQLSWEVARRTVSAGSIVAGTDRITEPTPVAT
jgi:glycosyltransferase involved in cell wall biosynthesis